MINTIILILGGFINLDKQATVNSLRNLGLSGWHEDLDQLNIQFETGQISREAFIEGLQNSFPMQADDEILQAWSAILPDFVSIEFLQMLSTKYRLFYSVTRMPSISKHSEQKNGATFYSDFYNFEKSISFEIGMRKPNSEIYKYVLNEHDLQAKRTLFIDDKRKY
jgi:putative hydrolase of the HAD superfamily